MADLNPVKILKRRKEVAQAYRDVFDSPSGQLVLAHLAKHNFVLSPAFVSGDPFQSALHEGQRRAVLSIMKFIGVDSHKILQMIEEQEHALS